MCGGHEYENRHQGKRCYGFRSDDGDWAHCTRPEFAGDLPVKEASQTYAHSLVGDCHCGSSHALTPSTTITTNGNHSSHIVATYDYEDLLGTPVFQVVRYDPKGFKQRRLDSEGSWIWNMNGVERVPFRLPELMAADPAGLVFITEGEKDANNLATLGLVATTNPMGAKKWADEYSEWLKGRNVVVLPHNDPVGYQHGQSVAKSLYGVANSVKVLELPGLVEDGGDVTDWLNQGHTGEELVELVDLMPTVVAAVGVNVPEGLDGRSFAPFLRGERPGGWRQEVFAEYLGSQNGDIPLKILRTERHKLVCSAEGPDELFDMARDPGELENRIDDPDYRDVLQDLVGRLERRMAKSRDPIDGFPRLLDG